MIAGAREASPPTIELADWPRPSLIASLIRLRPETFGAHHAGWPAEVTDPFDLLRTQQRRLGKRVGRVVEADQSAGGGPRASDLALRQRVVCSGDRPARVLAK